MSNLVLSRMIQWFAANNLVLKLNKTNIMKFITKNSLHSALHFGYRVKYTEETVNTKFLDLQIDNHIHWKNYTEQMIPELSATRHVVRSTVHISNINQFTVNTFIPL